MPHRCGSMWTKNWPKHTYTQTNIICPLITMIWIDDTVIEAGMAAGVYYSAWEAGDMGTYPDEALLKTPISAVQAPAEVTKIR
jgi:hypothetical protein